jgi:hypothetical protein
VRDLCGDDEPDDRLAAAAEQLIAQYAGAG